MGTPFLPLALQIPPASPQTEAEHPLWSARHSPERKETGLGAERALQYPRPSDGQRAGLRCLPLYASSGANSGFSTKQGLNLEASVPDPTPS